MNKHFGTPLAALFHIVMIASLALSACDVLRTAPFEIMAWSPGPGWHPVAGDIHVSVMFSEEPDRASAENSFSLTEDGTALSGTFSWRGSSLAFLPCGGLKPNAEYRMTVSADARNPLGVSLAQSFEVSFSSRPEAVRPAVVASFPGRDGILETKNDTVSITFSEAVDAVSLRDCISLSPSIKGIWKLQPGNTSAFFSPLEPWIWGTEYRLTIAAELLDISGNMMGEPYTGCFTVGVDREPPELLYAEAIDAAGVPVAVMSADPPQDGSVRENPGWEASWKLRLHYSEPVSWRSFSSAINGEGGVSLEAEWTGELSETLDVLITRYPDWGDSFSVRIPPGVQDAAGNASLAEAVFRFIFDGAGSRPPRFAGIRIPLAPGEALPADRNLAAYSVLLPYATIALSGAATAYPVGVAVATSIEVYVELAAGSSVNILSLMESFRFSSTNGALDFSASNMVAGYFESAEPYEPWAACAVARIDGTLTNHVDSGILTVQLAAGFSDSLGNATVAAQRLALLK